MDRSAGTTCPCAFHNDHRNCVALRDEPTEPNWSPALRHPLHVLRRDANVQLIYKHAISTIVPSRDTKLEFDEK